MSRKIVRAALVGCPNSGKTTLFNALTGSSQKTGNYPGVTVEKKEGRFLVSNIHSSEPIEVELLDLPGLYSLIPKSPDEALSSAVVRSHKDSPTEQIDLILAVADSTNLERSLYLVTQLRELGRPLVLILTMCDLSKNSKTIIDSKKLSALLGIPVVETAASRRLGLTELNSTISFIAKQLSTNNASPKTESIPLPEEPQFIEARYRYIEKLLNECVQQPSAAYRTTRVIDRIVLHPFLGPILLLVVFAVFFQMIFSVAKLPMEIISESIAGFSTILKGHLSEGIFSSLLTDGIIAGVGSVVVFLPQILILFTFIILFEDSGYMARAAFILDRLMSAFGLNGRAFIPLLSSFACAVPGIMSTRTIENRRDRLITILVAPLMTCSARLPVYSLLIGAFIPATKVAGFFTLPGLVMFGLYIFGVLTALIVSLVLGKTILRGQESTFLIELPTYKLPSIKNLVRALLDRSLIFLKRAGTIILGISVLLWALASFPSLPHSPSGNENERAQLKLEQSYLGKMGKWIEPAVAPLGFDWKIGIGILSSFAAREVLLSTLGTVYSVGSNEEHRGELVSRMRLEKKPDGTPLYSLATVLSMLIFYMLACQCISTLATTKRETNSWRWPAFMFFYMTILAYVSSFAVFHLTRQIFPTL